MFNSYLVVAGQCTHPVVDATGPCLPHPHTHTHNFERLPYSFDGSSKCDHFGVGGLGPRTSIALEPPTHEQNNIQEKTKSKATGTPSHSMLHSRVVSDGTGCLRRFQNMPAEVSLLLSFTVTHCGIIVPDRICPYP